MSTPLLFRCTMAWALCAALTTARVMAETPPPKTQTKAPLPQAAGGDSGVAAKRAEILKSERWQRAAFRLNEWISSQTYYDQKKLERLRAEWEAKVAKMSPAQLQMELEEMEAKLKFLQSSQAVDAYAWLAHNINLLADKPRDEIVNKLPNIATMTAPQLMEQVARIQERRSAAARRQTMYQGGGAAPVNPWTGGSSAAAQQAYIRDHSTNAPYYSPYRAPTAAEKPFADVTTSPQLGYYINGYGGFGLTYNPSGW